MARRPTRGGKKKPKVSLIVTSSKRVRVPVRPGTKLQVVQVETLTPELKRAGPIGARLCGHGSNVCLAIVDIEK